LIGSNHVKLANYVDSFDVSSAISFNIKTKKIEQLVKLGEHLGKRRVTLGQSRLGNIIGKTSDGKTLFIPSYISVDETDVAPKYSLLSVNVTGKGSPKIVVRGTKDTSGLIKNDHGVVLGMTYAGFSPDYKLLDDTINQRIKNIVTQFPGQSTHLSGWTKDWKHIVMRVDGSQFVGDYLLFTEGQAPKKIISSRLDISADQINPMVINRQTARDGLTIPTILTFPKENIDTETALPTVIMPHGGQDRVGFDYLAQALASRGFLVIQPQFRGSTGFGQKRYHAGFGQWGKDMQNDITDAINAFTKLRFVDPQKVCIVGASYGGYAALAGAAFTSD